jgi:hypothetical protein
VQQLGVSKGAVGRVRAAMAAATVPPQRADPAGQAESGQDASERLRRRRRRVRYPPSAADGTQGPSVIDAPLLHECPGFLVSWSSMRRFRV